MKLFVTVDTEADDWESFEAAHSTCNNIQELPKLHELFSKYGVRPTYLVSYRVADDPAAAGIMRSLLDTKTCEIGAHLHPWETPPLSEERSLRNTMLCNLQRGLQRAKIASLTEKLESTFDMQPVSFRAGRWGYSYEIASMLCDLGYLIDTSVTPYTSWSADEGPDFSNIELRSHWSDTSEVFPGMPALSLVEVPPSIGYLQQDSAAAHRLHKRIAGSFLRQLHIGGLLYYLGVLNKIWLSPEIFEAAQMEALVRRLREGGYPYANMVFHSQSLVPGLTQFVQTNSEAERFWRRLEQFLQHIADEGIACSTLREEFEVSDAQCERKEDLVEASST